MKRTLVVLVVCGCGDPGPRGAAPDGQPDGSGVCTHAVTLRYSSPGPDGTWGTDDDVIVERDDFDYDDQGENIAMDWYTGAGPDGHWVTSDDLRSHHYHATFQHGLMTERAEFDEPGDRQLSNSVFEYDAAGRRTVDTNTNLGSDGVWGTSDDKIGLRTVYTYDAAGHYRWVLVYDGPGADGMWGTHDDTFRSTFSITTDAGGNFVKVFENNSPGPDLIWGTDDDLPVRLYNFTCANSGDVVIVISSGPGADGMWGTADDPLEGQQRQAKQGTCGPDLCQQQLF